LTIHEEIIQSRVSLQQSILAECAGLPKQGGRLVYATCSLLEEENEEIVSWFLDRYPKYSLVSSPLVVDNGSDGDTITLLPHRLATDGFFAAIFTRS
jgi:16S rRNA (cytosine967-C5)-methyltransferase